MLVLRVGDLVEKQHDSSRKDFCKFRKVGTPSVTLHVCPHQRELVITGQSHGERSIRSGGKKDIEKMSEGERRKITACSVSQGIGSNREREVSIVGRVSL